MRVLLWVVLVAAFAVPVPAHAGKKKAKAAKLNKKIITPGEGWFCTRIESYVLSSSWCFRDEEVCLGKAESWVEDSPGNDASRCSYQAKAAIFTYFSVLEEASYWVAFGSNKDCKVSRSHIAQNPDDHSRVSACKAIGDIAWPKGEAPDDRPEPTPRDGICVTFSTAGVESQRCFWDYDDCQEAETKGTAAGATLVQSCI